KYLGFVYGTLNGKYQYVHFPQFNLSSWAATNPQFVLGMINFLAKPEQKHKGVIVDLRANSGGNSDEISLLVGNFINKKLEHGSIKVKYGPGRNDFSPWLPEYVYPNTRPETQGYNPLPIVVLCDRITGSNGELSTMVFSLLPQATILGDTTFGAYGAVAGPGSRKEVFGGTFKLPNGWEVSMASNVFRFKDGNVYEGIGFPPEILLPLDENQFAQGKDNQLEAALNILPK
ncbi:MAG: S41 family peptidase, partial [Chitinophagales bacterium]|nr:S41 family peptidase [Chitinophagales bacterium]